MKSHTRILMLCGLLTAMPFSLQGCGGDDNTSVDSNTDGNTAPIASAGTDQSVVAGNSVTLDASGSSDADGDVLSYSWAIVSFPVGSTVTLSSTTAAKPSFTADLVGTYAFQVTVSDGSTSSSDDVTITVTAAPTSNTGSYSTSGILCDYSQSTFNASASVNNTSMSSWTCNTSNRTISANGLPDHAVGTFPNANNPNTISAQSVAASYTLTPEVGSTATTLGGPRGPQGYGLNGVKIDASTAGTCSDSGSCTLIGNNGSWNIEALGQDSFDFGTDENNAHVQPDGAYHYHGMPELYITHLGGDASKMTLIGWAADGFPIYARYGYSDPDDAASALKVMTGSYQLIASSAVSSSRPSVNTYALGTFMQDWAYVAGSGDLDECNGRVGVTPEFPNGIYHYYATDTYPYFQRCVKGSL